MVTGASAAKLLGGGSPSDAGRLGLSEASYLGATVAHTGGITVDHGWLRLLGGGSGQLPSLASVNAASSGLCIVGFDVLGGVFALDGGALGNGDGGTHYFAPDSLEWEDLEITHSQFVAAMLSDAIDRFYEPFRWDGWRDDVAALALDRGFSFYPPLFTAEGKDTGSSSRREVSMAEVANGHWPGAGRDEGR